MRDQARLLDIGEIERIKCISAWKDNDPGNRVKHIANILHFARPVYRCFECARRNTCDFSDSLFGFCYKAEVNQ